MKIVIGGSFQGKRAYAEEKYGITEWARGANCGFDDIFCCKGLYGFQDYVRRAVTEGKSLDGLASELMEKNPGLVLVSDELGYGVVPAEPFDRAFRETHGRLMCALAAEAEEVVRVICGIGTVIRHG